MDSARLTEPLRETLSVFETTTEPLTTPEVASRLEIGRRSTYTRLERLVEADRLASKKVGANARVWWRPPSVDPDGAEQAPAGIRAELSEVFDRISDGFYTLDDAFRFRYMNERTRDILGVDERAIGEDFRDLIVMTDAFERALHDALDNQEPIIFEDYYPPADRWFYNALYPSESGLSVYFRDITEGKRRERELARFRDAVEASGNAICMLDATGDITYANATFEDVIGYAPEEAIGSTLTALQSPGAREDLDAVLDPVLDGTVRHDDLTDRRPDGTRYHVERTLAPVLADDGSVDRVIAVYNDVTDRIDRERELTYQREQLTALNSINEVVVEIVDVIIDQSTREEIEAVVCDRLASAAPYELAWIGEPDPGSHRVVPRASAGVVEYLDAIEISLDPTEELSRGPTGRAYLTGEVQVIQDVLDDPASAPWRDAARRHGFQATAAIPIVHEDIVYGVLNVHTARANAFQGHEGRIIGAIGEIVGHAIAATERKRALMSDELVELRFVISDIFAMLDRPIEAAGTITIDHAVPIADDDYLVFGTATSDAVDTVVQLVDAVPFWESVRFVSDGEPRSFELRMRTPPVLSAVTDLGGYIDDTIIEDGSCRITVHLAPGVSTRHVVSVVNETYPGADLVHTKTITRTHDDARLDNRRLADELTDRQRAALDAAYHAGYFSWPREQSAEAVAASLDIAPTTFHQHLRKAERKVLDALFRRQS